MRGESLSEPVLNVFKEEGDESFGIGATQVIKRSNYHASCNNNYSQCASQSDDTFFNYLNDVLIPVLQRNYELSGKKPHLLILDGHSSRLTVCFCIFVTKTFIRFINV